MYVSTKECLREMASRRYLGQEQHDCSAWRLQKNTIKLSSSNRNVAKTYSICICLFAIIQFVAGQLLEAYRRNPEPFLGLGLLASAVAPTLIKAGVNLVKKHFGKRSGMCHSLILNTTLYENSKPVDGNVT